MKRLKITVAGKVYDVTVEILEEGGMTPSASPPATATATPSTPAPVVVTSPAPAAAPGASPAASGPGGVTSPLAGRVVALSVTPGQSVKEGDQLLTLEAMKMNTYVFAHQDGKVGQIHVEVGSAVQEGQLLVSLT